MAVRDRNLFAWQAYVITMSIVSVALLVAVFFAWRGYSDASKKLEASVAEETRLKSEVASADSKVKLLQAYMGYSDFTVDDIANARSSFEADADMVPILAAYDQAMQLFAAGVAASDRNLLKLPKYLLETIRARNEDIDSNRAATALLKLRFDQTLAREKNAIKTATDAEKKAQADLTQLRVEHSKAVKEVNAQREAGVAKFDVVQREYRTAIAKVSSDLKKVAAENDTLLVTVQQLNDDLAEHDNPDFASPQGKVIRVAEGSRLVWINLGSDDGLRPGVVFSVLDSSEVNTTNAKPKARVVVTRVISAHTAIAKAADPLDYGNIIVSQDLVYSPAWRPGRKVGFALVGKMDINNDGRDDIEQIRSAIRLAGGKVDAAINANGTTGEIDYNTTWMVLGTDLTISDNASDTQRAEQQSRMESYSTFIKMANRNGVQKISIDKLMGYLKTQSSDRTVPLGDRMSARDFQIKPQRVKSSTGTVSELYSPRYAPK